MQKLKVFTVSALAAVVLSGCTTSAEKKASDNFFKADLALKDAMTAGKPVANQSIYSQDSGMHLNKTPVTTVKLDTKGQLPAKLKNKRVDLKILKNDINLSEVLTRLSDSDILGLRVTMQSEIRDGSFGGLATVIGNAGSENGSVDLGKEGTNVLGAKVPDIIIDEVDYKGTATGLLDMVANKANLSWKYVNGGVVFYKYEERIFELAALAGTTELEQTLKTMKSTSSGGDTNSSGSDQSGQSTVYKSKSSIWEDVLGSLRNTSTKGGRLSALPSAGRIVAVDTPEALNKMERQLEEYNKIYAKRIQLNVRIYQVEQTDADDYQINWNLALNKLAESVGATANTLSSTLSNAAVGIGYGGSGRILGDSQFSTALNANLAKMLSTVGKASLLTEATLETINGQIVPLTNTTEIAYVKSTSATSNDSSTSSTINPGKVTQGLTMSFLPRVSREGDVLVKYTLDLAHVDKIEKFDSPAGDATVQLPTVSSRNFSNHVKAKNNETLILAGFQQVQGDTSSSGIGSAKAWWLGGSKQNTATRTSLVIVITPTIME